MNTAQPKYPRPENPLTPKVVEDVAAKTNTILAKFQDFGNDERRESRRHDITGRLVAAVMRAHAKFVPNDSCSFETFAGIFVKREMQHCLRAEARALAKEKVTVSCDKPLPGGDDDDLSYIDTIGDPCDGMAASIDRCDFETLLELLERRNPRWSRIFSLCWEGYQLSEIPAIVGIPVWELYDVHWPAIKAIVRRAYGSLR